MVRKALLVLVSAAAVAVASQWREINRYVKLKQMSSGDGHPENVPVEGETAYPLPGRGANDGTGEFDSGSRGGPADAPPGPRQPGSARRGEGV